MEMTDPFTAKGIGLLSQLKALWARKVAKLTLMFRKHVLLACLPVAVRWNGKSNEG